MNPSQEEIPMNVGVVVATPSSPPTTPWDSAEMPRQEQEETRYAHSANLVLPFGGVPAAAIAATTAMGMGGGPHNNNNNNNKMNSNNCAPVSSTSRLAASSSLTTRATIVTLILVQAVGGLLFGYAIGYVGVYNTLDATSEDCALLTSQRACESLAATAQSGGGGEDENSGNNNRKLLCRWVVPLGGAEGEGKKGTCQFRGQRAICSTASASVNTTATATTTTTAAAINATTFSSPTTASANITPTITTSMASSFLVESRCAAFGDDVCFFDRDTHACKPRLGLSAALLGIFAGALVVGGMLGAVVGSTAVDRLGCRGAFLWAVACPAVVASILLHVARATDLYVLLVLGRVLLGIATGVACLVCPLYINEMSETTTAATTTPSDEETVQLTKTATTLQETTRSNSESSATANTPNADNHRKALGTLFQVFLTLGIAIAAAVGLALLPTDPAAEQQMPLWMQLLNSVQTLTAVLCVVMGWWMPETPFHATLLLSRNSIDPSNKNNNIDKKHNVGGDRRDVHVFSTEPLANTEASDKNESSAETTTVIPVVEGTLTSASPAKTMNTPPLSMHAPALAAICTILSTAKQPFAVAFVMTVANQFTGINAIMNYAPNISKAMGLAPLTGNLVIMIWNFVSTLAAIPLSSRLSERHLYLGGLVLATASLFLAGIPIYPGVISDASSPSSSSSSAVALKQALAGIGIFVFIFAFEVGIGPAFFVLAQELFPRTIPVRMPSTPISTSSNSNNREKNDESGNDDTNHSRESGSDPSCNKYINSGHATTAVEDEQGQDHNNKDGDEEVPSPSSVSMMGVTPSGAASRTNSTPYPYGFGSTIIELQSSKDVTKENVSERKIEENQQGWNNNSNSCSTCTSASSSDPSLSSPTSLIPLRSLGSSFTMAWMFTLNIVINVAYPIASLRLSGGPSGDPDKGQALAFIFFGLCGAVTCVILQRTMHPPQPSP